MTKQSNIMAGGMSAGAAQAIGGIPATGLTATGTSSQANALVLQADVNAVSTTASNSGVSLTTAQGDSQTVYNGGANALLVYPPVGSGASINAGAANASFSVGVSKSAIFNMVSSTLIIATLSA